MNCRQCIEKIQAGGFDRTLSYVYGGQDLAQERERYIQAVNRFESIFGDGEIELFSAPGRTEIGGNHTDHQHGRVLAAGINLDVIAVAKKTGDGVVKIQSEGYPMDVVSLDALSAREEETGKSASMVRGVCARFQELALKTGGFAAYTTTKVLKGSGLSSSAAFEVLTGTMMNHLYNAGGVGAVEIAKIAQFAERSYFGKPSGLMDQTASSVGGFVAIDFQDNDNPVIEKIDFDFTKAGHSLCILDTGGDHADLTADYAAITSEMREVARLLGGKLLREVDDGDFLSKIPSIRGKCSDRALIRAIHFFSENQRVLKEVDALKHNDFERFKQLIIESGNSSFEYLQNIYSDRSPLNQCVSLALACSQLVLQGRGAWRVHGGGFGGTIQAFVPDGLLERYVESMESVFGKGSCYVLRIRPVGGVKISG